MKIEFAATRIVNLRPALGQSTPLKLHESWPPISGRLPSAHARATAIPTDWAGATAGAIYSESIGGQQKGTVIITATTAQLAHKPSYNYRLIIVLTANTNTRRVQTNMAAQVGFTSGGGGGGGGIGGGISNKAVNERDLLKDGNILSAATTLPMLPLSHCYHRRLAGTIAAICSHQPLLTFQMYRRSYYRRRHPASCRRGVTVVAAAVAAVAVAASSHHRHHNSGPTHVPRYP